MVGGARNAERTTTYGVGQLMAAALDAGCKKLVVGLGGSATNDGGCGAAAALGAVFLDKNGTSFVPVGRTLKQVDHIDLRNLHPRLKEVPVIAMCDVDTPLCGPTGAAAVFGPQKGADPAMVARLDAGLQNLADVVRRDTGKEILDLPGAGAAGGMGGGMAALLGAQMQMGIETVLDTVGFNAMLDGAEMVFTGEGKLDTQSLRGKVVLGVAHRAQKAGVPVVAVVGDIGDHIEQVYEQGGHGSVQHQPCGAALRGYEVPRGRRPASDHGKSASLLRLRPENRACIIWTDVLYYYSTISFYGKSGPQGPLFPVVRALLTGGFAWQKKRWAARCRPWKHW